MRCQRWSYRSSSKMVPEVAGQSEEHSRRLIHCFRLADQVSPELDGNLTVRVDSSGDPPTGIAQNYLCRASNCNVLYVFVSVFGTARCDNTPCLSMRCRSYFVPCTHKSVAQHAQRICCTHFPNNGILVPVP